jgi:hypothetical protein
MSKRSSKSKRRSKVLPALGFAGVSFSMASGACASTTEASANTPPTSQSQSNEIFLADEEISDVSLSTFYTFDKENIGAPPQLRLARGCGCHGCGGCGGRGCGCGGGGWHGGCGGWHGGCGFHRACRCGGFRFRGCGCGGCGGCGGNCWIWPWGWCWWGESTPPAEVASVKSERLVQTAEAAGKGGGNIDRTRTK